MIKQSKNPLICDQPEDTLGNASAVLFFLSSIKFDEIDSIDEDDDFGLSLVLDTVRVAVDDAAKLITKKKTKEVQS